MTALGEFDQMDLGKPIEGVFDVIGCPSSRPRNNCFINNRGAPAEKTIDLSTNLAIKRRHPPTNLGLRGDPQGLAPIEAAGDGRSDDQQEANHPCPCRLNDLDSHLVVGVQLNSENLRLTQLHRSEQPRREPSLDS